MTRRKNGFLRVVDRVATLPFPVDALVLGATLLLWVPLLEFARPYETAQGWIAFLMIAYVIGGGFFLWWRWWLIRFERDEGERTDG